MRALGLAGGLGGLWTNFRLAWRLLQDGRVPPWNKLVFPATILYLLWPLDIILDVLPFLGQVDDVTAIVLAMLFFVRTSPREVVEEHRATIEGRAWRARDERSHTVEAQYRVLEDEESR